MFLFSAEFFIKAWHFYPEYRTFLRYGFSRKSSFIRQGMPFPEQTDVCLPHRRREAEKLIPSFRTNTVNRGTAVFGYKNFFQDLIFF